MRRTGGGPDAPGDAAALLLSIADSRRLVGKASGWKFGELQSGPAGRLLSACPPLTLAAAGLSASMPEGIVQHAVVWSGQHSRLQALWNALPKQSSAANIHKADRHVMEGHSMTSEKSIQRARGSRALR